LRLEELLKLKKLLKNKRLFEYFKHSLELSDTHDFNIKTREDVLEALKTLKCTEKQITGFLEEFYKQEVLRLEMSAFLWLKIFLFLLAISIFLQIINLID